MTTTIGENVRRWRKRAGLTQFELAKKINPDNPRQADVSEMERNLYEASTLPKLAIFATALGCSIGDLLADTIYDLNQSAASLPSSPQQSAQTVDSRDRQDVASVMRLLSPLTEDERRRAVRISTRT